MRRKPFKIADLFCGAGGTSTGARQACAEVGVEVDLLAINHWDVAIATHTANHPDATHLCENLDSVDPRKLFPGGRINLLCASPECTHHSVARGGRPINDQSRASAWHIVRWAEALYIDALLIENVPEFLTWGPIGADGRPLKSRRGQTFAAFVDALRSLDYSVEWRVLNCADYGDPTTRERLFIQARRGGRKITWPAPTHARPIGAQEQMFGQLPSWRAAREIIDWSIPGASIFERKRPLAPATMDRIAAGLKKFGGANAEPFLVVLRNHMGARSLDAPVPTVTAGGQNYGLCEPFLVPAHHGKGDTRVNSLDDPAPTVLGSNSLALVEPFILGQQSCSAPRSTQDPLPTVATAGAISLVEPFLVSYYGTQNTSPVGAPVPTCTTRDRFGVVEPDGVRRDIRFRMLTPRELARAQGFPDDYEFAGTREARVKQIGNAVPVNTARALCSEILRGAA